MRTVDVQALTARLVEWHDRLPWASEMGPIAAAAIAELAAVPIADAFAVSASLAARWFGKMPARAA